MSDFDPKNIPTLDDIIEVEAIDETATISVENEESLDLFDAEQTDENRDAEPATGIPNDPLDNTPSALTDINHEVLPFLTTHSFEETYDDSAYPLNYEIKYEDLITYDDLIDFNPITPIQALDVEKIVKSVVKQMMPDLEQQLRFLIQQALEKQLPAELVQSSDNKTNDS